MLNRRDLEGSEEAAQGAEEDALFVRSLIRWLTELIEGSWVPNALSKKKTKMKNGTESSVRSVPNGQSREQLS